MIIEALTKQDSSGFLEDELKTLFEWDWNNNLIHIPKQSLRFSLGHSEFIIEIPHSAPWFEIALQKLIDLEDLKDNWDSEGAPPIDIDCIFSAILLLAQITQDNTPEPYVFPTIQGGIQFEWHTKKVDLEIEIVDPLTVVVLFDDEEEKEHDWEQKLTQNDLPKLIDCIIQLV